MAVPRGLAAYKKKEGIITLTDDRASLIWTPGSGTGPPVVSLAVANITNLQKTPDTSPKVMLKIFEKPRTSEGDAVAYLFHFTSKADARAEANAIKDLLSALLAEARGGDPNLPKPVAQGGDATDGSAGASAAMSFAATANAKPVPPSWFNDDALKKDVELQQSLLNKDARLNQVYTDALSTKPDSISDAAFNAEFWSTRVGLLRAHAIEQNQTKGAYHVLSTIKPRIVDGELKLSLVKDQVQMIFKQHPLVKRIYNENVPKPLKEMEFWSRFFLSRLFKQLRGERLLGNEGGADPLFDKYSEADNTMGFASKIKASQVPQFIDLEANEENQGGFKSGNRKDVEMRQRRDIPIVKTLNSVSEKIMAEVAPTDASPADETRGPEEVSRNLQELALKDLLGDPDTQRIALNVKEQQVRLFQNQNTTQSEEAKMYAKQNPTEVLFDVQADLETIDEDGAGGMDLHKAIGVDDESESEGEGGTKKAAHVGSRVSRKLADNQIVEGLLKTRAEVEGIDNDETSPMEIPPEITERCKLTNMTTTEFLRQFWSALLSSDPRWAAELADLRGALGKSVERITALADEAEAVRVKLDNQRKSDIREHFKKTGKKLRYIPVKGGRAAVLALFESTLCALTVAEERYAATLRK